jgi:hypothetical protein
MPERDRLIFFPRTGQSTLLDWNKKMTLFMEAVFGAKASPVFRERMLPRCMRSDQYIPSPGLPEGDDPVSVKAREIDYSEWRQERREFITSQAQMVSTYMTGTLSQSSLDRIKDTRETDMDQAIANSDILSVHKIVWECHQYRGKTFKVADQQRVQQEFTMFNIVSGESLVSLKRRLSELLEKMKNYDVPPSDFQVMFTFLMAAAKHSSIQVQDICLNYLKHIDDDTKFPSNLNEVYEEMTNITDVVNQVANRHKSRQSHEGSVHQAALRQQIKSMSDKRQKGNNNNNKGHQPKGQVNSAYSNINKNVKKKLENQTMSGKSKNVHTEKHCREMMAKNPNLTYRNCLDSLPPCARCRKRWHLESDCRKGNDHNKGEKKHVGGPKKPSRKKYVAAKGKVNNAVGRSKNFYEDLADDSDWIGSVFAVVGCQECYNPITPKVVFSSDEELDMYLSGELLLDESLMTKSYEEISNELEE